MQSIVGIFTERQSAEGAATALRVPEIAGDRVSMLTPDMSRREVVGRDRRGRGAGHWSNARRRRRSFGRGDGRHAAGDSRGRDAVPVRRAGDRHRALGGYVQSGTVRMRADGFGPQAAFTPMIAEVDGGGGLRLLQPGLQHGRRGALEVAPRSLRDAGGPRARCGPRPHGGRRRGDGARRLCVAGVGRTHRPPARRCAS